MFNKCGSSYKLQKIYRDNPELLNIDQFVINVPSIPKSSYVTLKINAKPSITRVDMLCILSGEIWYLREIIIQAVVRGYEDAKSFLWDYFYNISGECACEMTDSRSR